MTASRRPSRILVTGGAGFIGSHLVERLVARGDNVVVIDDLSTGRRENLAHVDMSRVTFIDGKVADALGNFEPGEFGEIYHLAAAVGVRLVIEQPVHTIETNIRETSAVLDFAAPAHTPTLIASSSEVYGKSTKSPFAEDDDVVYGPTIYPRWSYACSKAIDEYLALAHFRMTSLPTYIIRFFNTVGPRQVGRYGMVLPRFIAAARAGRPLEVHGDGQQVRCFCDVRDVVRALIELMQHRNLAGRVFNLGSDQPIGIAALAHLVCETLCSASEIHYVDYQTAFGSDFEDLRCRVPDLTRIREAIGFEPSISLEQTIMDVAEDLSGRPDPSTAEPVR